MVIEDGLESILQCQAFPKRVNCVLKWNEGVFVGFIGLKMGTSGTVLGSAERLGSFLDS